jgi:hypothetical protein
MLRGLAVALLLANLLFFTWTQGWLDGLLGVRAHADREPERLARQFHPEIITIIAPGSAAAASEPASGPSSGAPGTTASMAIAPVCLEAGPFATGASVSAIATLQATVPASRWVEVKTERPGAWIVYMGRFANREALAKKEDELRRTRVSFEPVSTPAELEFGFSFGRFDQRAAAERSLEQLTQRGIRTARVVELQAPATLHTLRVEKAEPAIAAQLLALKADTLGRGFAPCAN